MSDRDPDLSPWVPELGGDATLDDRVRRLEGLAVDYYHSSLASADLTQTVAELTVTAAGVRRNLDELHKARVYLNRVYVLAAAVAVAVLAGSLVAYIAFTSQRLDAASFQRSVVERCEQREAQSQTIRFFADLEIERLRRSSLPPDQEAESIASLETLRDGFPKTACEDLTE